MRADLQQHLAIQIGEGAHALGKFHRLARVATPVGAVKFHAPAERGAAAVAHQNPLRRTEIEPVGKRLELVEDRIQQRRMEPVAGIQPVTPDTVGRQPGHRLVQILRGPRKYGIGTVVGGNRQTWELVGETLDALGGGGYRDHPTARRQTAEKAAALGHQQRAVLEAEHARNARRRILADAVAQHHIGFEAPRLPEPGQAHLHREQGGLGVAGLPQRLLVVGAVRVENNVQQWLFENVSDHCRAAGQCLGEHRLGVEELPGHAGVLAALTGEQPRRLRRVIGYSAHQTRCRTVVRERAEQLTGGFRRIDNQRGPVLEVCSPHPGGEAHVRQGGLRVRAQPGAVLIGDLHQCGGRARR